LVAELTKPVMPEEENFEYLPTQIVAEYLAEKIKPNIDGIIFSSSQTQNDERNIILFHNSCAVEPFIIPEGTTISVDYGWCTEEDHDDSITVLEEYTKNTSNQNVYEPIFRAEYPEDYNNNREPTLRLDVNKDISVRVIKRAVYESSKRYVSRHRFEKSGNEKRASGAGKIDPFYSQF
jgi:hypothetical protein